MDPDSDGSTQHHMWLPKAQFMPPWVFTLLLVGRSRIHPPSPEIKLVPPLPLNSF